VALSVGVALTLLAVTLHSTPSDMQAPSDIPERVDLDALPRRGVTTQSPNQLGLLRLVLADNESRSTATRRPHLPDDGSENMIF
jgi:hypothetical protein